MLSPLSIGFSEHVDFLDLIELGYYIGDEVFIKIISVFDLHVALSGISTPFLVSE
tara:strand:- start:332 stop:496 length:165 start_codon:yes stop_codon:yes gene_type:complete